MADVLMNAGHNDAQIPPSLWVAGIGVSMVAIPLLFITDILVLTLGLVGLFVIIICANERYRLFTLVALLPFAHAGIGWSELGGFGPYDIFLGWFVLLYLWRVGPLTLFQVPIPRPLCLGGVMLLTFIPGVINSEISVETVKAFLQLFASILTAAGVYDILQKRNDEGLIRSLLIVFVGVAAAVSLYGLLETIISGLLVKVATGRAYFSLFQDVNYYSGYLLMALSVAVGLMLSAKRNIPRLLFLGSAVVLIVAIIATVSRSALATLILLGLTYIVYFFMQRGVQKWIGALMIAGVAGILGVVIFTGLGQKMVDLLTVSRRVETVIVGRDASLQQRANILVVTLQIIESHPFVGVGFGSFEETYERYKGTYLSTGFKRSAHNTYLRVAAESGVIGFSGLLAFLASLMGNVARGVRLTRRGPWGVVFLSIAFSLATFLLMSATLDQMFEPHFWVMVGIALACVMVLRRQATANEMNAGNGTHG